MARNASKKARASKRVMQTDVPRVSLEQALRVPLAIAENYASEPTRPIDVALALSMTPTSGGFRTLCGAAIGYGLTEGGPNASQISLTELGRKIASPLAEGEDSAAKRDAVLVPTVERQFLERYDGSPIPPENIALNVLESLGVPRNATKRVHKIIEDNASQVGYVKEIKGKRYIDLGPPSPIAEQPAVEDDLEHEEETPALLSSDHQDEISELDERGNGRARQANRKVFISHGRNRRIVDQLKQILAFGDFEPVVSVDRESSSKPVPKKVLDDMRACSAGIIHLSPEPPLPESENGEIGEGLRILNQNVLIEIGAAMALFDDRFILLVENETELPSNLQGLYEVRYSGDELAFDSIMKVLNAVKSVNNSQ